MSVRINKVCKLHKLQFSYCIQFVSVDPIGPILDQGPVVQSIVSLTSSLRGQLVKCFMTL